MEVIHVPARVIAFVIDGLPAGLLVGLGQVVMVATGKNECVSDSSDTAFSAVCTSQPSGLGLTVSLVCSVLALAYVVWNYGYRQGTTGSSIGKSIMKFKVVSEKTGAPIGFGLSIVRQLAHLVEPKQAANQCGHAPHPEVIARRPAGNEAAVEVVLGECGQGIQQGARSGV